MKWFEKKGKKKYVTKKEIDWTEVFIILAFAIPIMILWNTALIYPFKLFVVLIHEISHGLAAILTGGAIQSIQLGWNESGMAITKGGSKLAVYSAGYLGSLIFGIFVLKISELKKITQPFLILLGGGIICVALLFIQNYFGVIYSIFFGGILCFVAFKSSETIRYYFVRILGVLTILYAIYDIVGDLFISPMIDKEWVSDSILLGEVIGVPPLLIAVIWSIIAGWILYRFFIVKYRKVEVY